MDHSHSSWRSRIANALEVSSTIVPVLVLVLGIGMMRIFPHSPSMAVFSSQSEAEAFFADYQIEFRPKAAVIVASKNCRRCNDLRESLVRQNIPHTELNMDVVPGAAQLFSRIQKLTGDPELPKVLVGTRLVPANPIAIKSATKALEAAK
jgi:hypothetical protein